MSAFDFPTWAQKLLSGKPEEPKPQVQQMPTPTLDEIDAMQKPAPQIKLICKACRHTKFDWDGENGPIICKACGHDQLLDLSPKRKPGRPAKVKT